MHRSRGGRGGPDPPPPTLLKNHKNIGFSSNTGPDPMKNHTPTKPAFNVGDFIGKGQLIVVFRSSLLSSKKTTTKNHHTWTPSDKIFWIRACKQGPILFVSSYDVSIYMKQTTKADSIFRCMFFIAGQVLDKTPTLK